MDKRRAIQILTNAAVIYKENLEDQKVLFLYGLPPEVKNSCSRKGRFYPLFILPSVRF
jgi:hypothetical protein